MPSSEVLEELTPDMVEIVVELGLILEETYRPLETDKVTGVVTVRTGLPGTSEYDTITTRVVDESRLVDHVRDCFGTTHNERGLGEWRRDGHQGNISGYV